MSTDHHDHCCGGHDEPAAAPPAPGKMRPLVIALGITLTVMVVEAAGGVLTGSLALLADAGHMATDAAALALALGASWLARRPATARRTFGFLRAEVLAAFINAATLIAVALLIVWEAASRAAAPPMVDTGPMLAIGVVGLLANAASAWVLLRGGGHHHHGHGDDHGHGHDMNLRGALLHVMGDMLGSVGAIVAAVVMLATGWYLVDPILSAGISLLILWSSWRLLRESVDVLLEAAPSGVDLQALRDAMAGVPGVAAIHDLHVWTLTSSVVSLSGHVEVARGHDWPAVLRVLNGVLRDRFGIVHTTLQPEEAHASPDAYRGCAFGTPEGRTACIAMMMVGAANAHAHHGHRH